MKDLWLIILSAIIITGIIDLVIQFLK